MTPPHRFDVGSMVWYTPALPGYGYTGSGDIPAIVDRYTAHRVRVLFLNRGGEGPCTTVATVESRLRTRDRDCPIDRVDWSRAEVDG